MALAALPFALLELAVPGLATALGLMTCDLRIWNWALVLDINFGTGSLVGDMGFLFVTRLPALLMFC